jgi:hypothetical protein
MRAVLDRDIVEHYLSLSLLFLILLLSSLTPYKFRDIGVPVYFMYLEKESLKQY